MSASPRNWRRSARRGARAVAGVGIPRNPGAWLMATAKQRAIDPRAETSGSSTSTSNSVASSRPNRSGGAGFEAESTSGPTTSATTCCASSSALPSRADTEARVALTLRLLGGLTTEEIARAFLVSEPTVAQRIVRAKRTLAAKRVPFEVPRGDELAARLSSVLGVIYLIFNEGTRRPLAGTGCGPLSAKTRCGWDGCSPSSCPQEPEVHGLVALMEIQASRSRARVGPSGEPIVLFEQNRALGIGSSSAAASRRSSGPGRSARAGLYALQARSPPATRARARRRKRTGRTSRSSTSCSYSSRRRRSSS